jgi:Ni/Co efflux regulator RcnB
MLVLAVVGAFAVGQSLADKPSWAGSGKGKSEHSGKSDKQSQQRDAQGAAAREHFGERHRTVVRDYYSGEFSQGRRCPPGLAKKHNGCMPPGQAKKWTVGRPLPRDVIYYDVPRPLIAQLDPVPAGHRYVRVASDILLIALGTGRVIDAIQNLGRS